MIKRNMNLNFSNKPFLLKPFGKDYLWGGNRLNDDFSKNISISPFAESWECSTHPDGECKVGSGKDKGKVLSQVLKENPSFLGRHKNEHGVLPILIKLIDAKQDLSVQVHPNDEYAMTNEDGSLGKTEMWYILDACADTNIIYGFNRDMNRELIQNSLQDNSIIKYLQKVPIQKDQVYVINPGTVHAIGKGALIAEIQENSNLTYRLYDYDRIDKNGDKRQLHIDKALDVIDICGGKEPRQPMRILRYQPGCASELLHRCQHFQVERLLVNTERCRDLTILNSDSLSFQVLLCIDGCGLLINDDESSVQFFKGDCIFIPASSCIIKMHGNAQFLKTTC